jgi:terminase small subunit / prophage DNA-packing protein
VIRDGSLPQSLRLRRALRYFLALQIGLGSRRGVGAHPLLANSIQGSGAKSCGPLVRGNLRKMPKRNESDNVSAAELARLWGVSDRSIREMAKAGIVVRTDRGRYAREKSTQRYCEHLRKAAAQRGDPTSLEDLRAAKLRLATEQADKLSIANAVRRGELLEAAEVERGWSGILRGVSAGMLTVTAQCGVRLPHLTRADLAVIDGLIRARLTELGGGNE